MQTTLSKFNKAKKTLGLYHVHIDFCHDRSIIHRTYARTINNFIFKKIN